VVEGRRVNVTRDEFRPRRCPHVAPSRARQQFDRPALVRAAHAVAPGFCRAPWWATSLSSNSRSRSRQFKSMSSSPATRIVRLIRAA